MTLCRAANLTNMGMDCCEVCTHLEWVRSHCVPSGQQWSLSSQQTAFKEEGDSSTSGSQSSVWSNAQGRKGDAFFQTNKVAKITKKHTRQFSVSLFEENGTTTQSVSIHTEWVTFAIGQQPHEASGSWQQVVSSGHSDVWSGHRTAHTASSFWTHTMNQLFYYHY